MYEGEEEDHREAVDRYFGAATQNDDLTRREFCVTVEVYVTGTAFDEAAAQWFVEKWITSSNIFRVRPTITDVKPV